MKEYLQSFKTGALVLLALVPFVVWAIGGIAYFTSIAKVNGNVPNQPISIWVVIAIIPGIALWYIMSQVLQPRVQMQFRIRTVLGIPIPDRYDKRSLRKWWDENLERIVVLKDERNKVVKACFEALDVATEQVHNCQRTRDQHAKVAEEYVTASKEAESISQLKEQLLGYS